MYKKVFTKTNLLFLIILLGAAFLRIVFLEVLPSGFHRDEIISGYVGRYILQNGKDLYGNLLPLMYFDKYGDYPPVIPMYFSGIGTILLGASAFATRLPVALMGILFLIPLYLLAKLFFGKKEIALLSCLIAAIMPWHVVLSRATAEGVIALTIVGFGLYYLLSTLTKPSPRYLFSAVLLFTLSYFLYPSFRILTPLIFLPIPFLLRSHRSLRNLSIIAFIFFVILTGVIGSTTWGKGRFDQTSILSVQNKESIESRADILSQEEGSNNNHIARTFHNKGVLYTKQVIAQYLSYFSLRYHFISGGMPYRYVVPDVGLLFLTFLPFLLLGCIQLVKKDNPLFLYLLFLLAIAPIPAALTIDDIPNIHRSIFMILPLTLIMGLGWYTFWRLLPRKLSSLGIILPFFFLFFEGTFFLHQYGIHSNKVKSILRSDTNKEMMQYVITQKDEYSAIIMPVHDVLPIFYLFYTNNFDPMLAGTFRANMRFDAVDNVQFVDNNCPSKDILPKGKTLFVDDGECPLNGSLTVLQVFSRHDGTKGFRVSESP